MSPDIDLATLRRWVGRSETRSDIVSAQLVAAYRATLLDRDDAVSIGDPAPGAIHWCLAAPVAPISGVGPDGHPARGGFLPPVPLPRRMWAGSRIRFHDPLLVGDVVERVSTIADVKAKEGRSGPLCFVTVSHVLRTGRGEALREEQDLVYRGPAAAGGPREAARPAEPPAVERSRTVEASPVLLFRYSALTFNGHRIHYDHPYATQVEAYPGLVVHGPLQASLLLELAASMRDGETPAAFEFRALRPLCAPEPIALNGRWRDTRTVELWTGDADHPHVAATAAW